MGRGWGDGSERARELVDRRLRFNQGSPQSRAHTVIDLSVYAPPPKPYEVYAIETIHCTYRAGCTINGVWVVRYGRQDEAKHSRKHGDTSLYISSNFFTKTVENPNKQTKNQTTSTEMAQGRRVSKADSSGFILCARAFYNPYFSIPPEVQYE